MRGGGGSRSSRRVSVLDQSEAIAGEMREMQASLEALWDRIGLEAAEREDRVATIYQHFRDLIARMQREEGDMEAEFEENVASLEAELESLSKGLGRAKPSLAALPKGLLPKVRALQKEVEVLAVEKRERVERAESLTQTLAEAAQALEREPPAPPAADIPTAKELSCLETQAKDWTRLAETRKERVREAFGRVQHIAAEMDLSGSAFVRALLAKDGSAYSLSDPAMAALEAGLAVVESDWAAHCEAMSKAFHTARDELEDWLEKCLVPTEQRQSLRLPGVKELYAQADIDAVTAETARWRDYYEERRGILELAEAWEVAWNEKLAMASTEGTAKYNNRGGGLQKFLRRQQQLEKELPKMEEKLARLLDAWRREHPHESLSFQGSDPLEHIERVKAAAEAAKERTRAEKEAAKRRELMEATTFGKTPLTPASTRKKTAGSTFTKASRPVSVVTTPRAVPVLTRQGLTVLTPTHRSASKLRSPTPSIYSNMKTPASSTRSASRLGPPSAVVTPLSGKRLRKADSLKADANPVKVRRLDVEAKQSENIHPQQPKLRSSPRIAAATAAAGRHPLEETIAEKDFCAGNFHNSSFKEPRLG